MKPQSLKPELRALSLDELIDNFQYYHATTASKQNQDKVTAQQSQSLLNKWAKAYSNDDQSAFVQRLAWDNLTEKDALDLLSLQDSEHKREPQWLSQFKEIRSYCSLVSLTEKDKQFDNSTNNCHTFIFTKITKPFILYGREQLNHFFNQLYNEATSKGGISFANEKISFESHAQLLNALEKQLLRELSRVSELSLYESFNEFKATHSVTLSSDDNYQSNELTQRFIKELLNQQLNPLLEYFPVLARHMCLLVSFWIESIKELFSRLQNDYSELCKLFNNDQSIGQLSSLEPALSDRHQHGRRVIALGFSSGLKLIYKPRSVTQEFAYNQLLTQLKNETLDSCPAPYQVLDKQYYGWIEYIDASECQSTEQIHSYYQQAGFILCLMYLLGGNDCHMENVIATQSGPKIIDIESLLQPQRQQSSVNKSAFANAQAQLDNSVINSALLQYLQTDSKGIIYDASGLRGKNSTQQTIKQRVWKHINSDALQLDYEPQKPQTMHNLIHYNGKPVSAEDYVNDICYGFNQCYQYIVSNQSLFTTDSGLMKHFKRSQCRIIFRSSQQYALLLHGLATPRYQQHGIDRSIIIHSLGQAFQGSKEKPALWELHKIERISLENLDIPYFTIPVTDTEFIDNGKKLSSHFTQSGYAAFLSRLDTFNQDDCVKQIEIIRNVLDKHAAKHHMSMPEQSTKRYFTTDNITKEKIVKHAEHFAQQLAERAIYGSQGEVTWLFNNVMHSADDQLSKGTAYYLYDGALGVALFLAALAVQEGISEKNKTRYIDLVMASCRPIKHLVDSDISEQLLVDESIGICNGLGSIVYSLLAIAKIFESTPSLANEFHQLAKQMASFITPERIHQDRHFDLESGTAGALISLLSLYERNPNTEILEQAQLAGDHLIQHAKPQIQGVAWENKDNIALLGHAHGVSGIAMALIRLYNISGEERYLNTAKQALLYEDYFYDQAKSNWPVLSKTTKGQVNSTLFFNTWCHGAPGIALDRSFIHNTLAEETNKLQQAIEQFKQIELTAIDHLCCGNMGRAEILHVLSDRLEQPDLLKQAHFLSSQIFARAEQTGHFYLYPNIQDNNRFTPGFFRGDSGILYCMLRIFDKKRLPSILSFELNK